LKYSSCALKKKNSASWTAANSEQKTIQGSVFDPALKEANSIPSNNEPKTFAGS
jgi:hypothetical protein